MGRYCEICKKGVMSGNTVSHSKRRARTSWAPNIQKVTLVVDGKPVKMSVCTRCLRTCKKAARAQA